MNTIRNLTIYFLLLFTAAVNAIAQNKVRPLRVGEKLPDFELSMYNYIKPSAKISDFKGKAILLDFWATWCAPCVASFPKLVNLQQKFAAELMILPVTYEKSGYVKSFGDRLKSTKQFDFTSVVEDVDLNNAFPHSSVPHYVWVNKEGIIKGISYMEDVTEQNLQKLISEIELTFQVKNEGTLRENPYESIFKDSSVIYHQALTKYLPGVATHFSFPGGINKGNGILLGNNSLLTLYQIAYGQGITLISGFKYTRLITNDSTKFTDNSGDGRHSTAYRVQWIKDHGLNYVLKVPSGENAKIWDIMRENLKRYFPEVSAKLIKEERPALVLQRTDDKASFAAKGSSAASPFQDATRLKIQNGTMRLLINMLKYYYQNSPYSLVDETNYKGRIDINLEANMSNITSLNVALNRYGLKLVKTSRKQDILELTDHGTKTNSE